MARSIGESDSRWNRRERVGFGIETAMRISCGGRSGCQQMRRRKCSDHAGPVNRRRPAPVSGGRERAASCAAGRAAGVPSRAPGAAGEQRRSWCPSISQDPRVPCRVDEARPGIPADAARSICRARSRPPAGGVERDVEGAAQQVCCSRGTKAISWRGLRRPEADRIALGLADGIGTSARKSSVAIGKPADLVDVMIAQQERGRRRSGWGGVCARDVEGSRC